jgi:hypothetical protein
MRPKKLHALLSDLVSKLPPGSVIALESGGDLDGRVLPQLDDWEVRRYGGTRIAIRTNPERTASSSDADDVEPEC